ncbi:MAG: hypothetical protein K8R23_00145 [Chthoniobacter sp.]|nr:hypothetical protein [Chthoniobacter sp.]
MMIKITNFRARVYFLIALLLCGSAFADESKIAGLVARGDAEEKRGHTHAALKDFRAAEALDPKNVGILIRIAQQYADLVDVTKPSDAAKQCAQQSLDYAQRALALDAKSAKAHLAVAVGYGKLTDFVANKTKLEYSKIIKEETEKSLELDPTNDFAWSILGRWHAGMANVNGVLKVLANVVYGGVPTASNEDAERCLKKAAELAPRRILHRAELARLYKIMGQSDLAAKEWQTVLALPAVEADDEKEKASARIALKLPANPTS